MSVILIVGGLILLKGVTAKRVYKNWPLDVMETTIYFNLVAFSALTWYNMDFGGNQVAVAYTSVAIIIILFLVVVAYHVLFYTRLRKWSEGIAKNGFKWAPFIKMLRIKRRKTGPPNEASGDLTGYRLAPGDQGVPAVTHTELELQQIQVQEE